MFRLTTVVLSLAVAMLCSSGAWGQLHPGDIFLDVEDGRIVTGKINPDQTPSVPMYVFGAIFGDSGFDGFTASPGFDTHPGTFPIGTAIGFNVLAGWQVWNGEEFEPADGETLFISFGSNNVTVADQPVNGFTINVQPDGGWHRHLNYFIQGPGGQNPLPGIYLLEMELFSTSPNIDASEPFFKVFNYNMPNTIHQDVIAWVEENMLDDDACPADLNGDGAVNVLDLLIVLESWGLCDDPNECPADLNGDGAVNVLDLLIVLESWGPCP